MEIKVKVKKGPLDFYKPGDRVMRSSQWQYHYQDCDMNGNQTEGTVIHVNRGPCNDHPLRIQWDGGNTNVYRIADIVKVKSLS